MSSLTEVDHWLNSLKVAIPTKEAKIRKIKIRKEIPFLLFYQDGTFVPDNAQIHENMDITSNKRVYKEGEYDKLYKRRQLNALNKENKARIDRIAKLNKIENSADKVREIKRFKRDNNEFIDALSDYRLMEKPENFYTTMPGVRIFGAYRLYLKKKSKTPSRVLRAFVEYMKVVNCAFKDDMLIVGEIVERIRFGNRQYTMRVKDNRGFTVQFKMPIEFFHGCDVGTDVSFIADDVCEEMTVCPVNRLRRPKILKLYTGSLK